MTVPRVLAEYARTQILRQVVNAKVTSQGGTVGTVDTVTGRVTARRNGPFVRQWGST
jgi:hypothetical protein